MTVGCSSTTRASGSSRCFMPRLRLFVVDFFSLNRKASSPFSLLSVVNTEELVIHGFERRGEGGWGRGEERGLLVF